MGKFVERATFNTLGLENLGAVLSGSERQYASNLQIQPPERGAPMAHMLKGQLGYGYGRRVGHDGMTLMTSILPTPPPTSPPLPRLNCTQSSTEGFGYWATVPSRFVSWVVFEDAAAANISARDSLMCYACQCQRLYAGTGAARLTGYVAMVTAMKSHSVYVIRPRDLRKANS